MPIRRASPASAAQSLQTPARGRSTARRTRCAPLVAKAHDREPNGPAPARGRPVLWQRIGDQRGHSRRTICPAKSVLDKSRATCGRATAASPGRANPSSIKRGLPCLNCATESPQGRWRARRYLQSRRGSRREAGARWPKRMLALPVQTGMPESRVGDALSAVGGEGGRTMQRTSYKPLPMARMRAGVSCEPPACPAEAGAHLDSPAIRGDDRPAPGRGRDDPRGSDASRRPIGR